MTNAVVATAAAKNDRMATIEPTTTGKKTPRIAKKKVTPARPNAAVRTAPYNVPIGNRTKT